LASVGPSMQAVCGSRQGPLLRCVVRCAALGSPDEESVAAAHASLLTGSGLVLDSLLMMLGR